MKNICYLLLLMVVFSACGKKVHKNYVTISGTIKNHNPDVLKFYNSRSKLTKTIQIRPDGTFYDTLKIKADSEMFTMFHRRYVVAKFYLKNGYDLTVNYDANNFQETFTVRGIGEEANNYLANKSKILLKADYIRDSMKLNTASFDKKMLSIKSDLKSLLETTKINLDSAFVLHQENENERILRLNTSRFDNQHGGLTMKGRVSPKFVDYENYAGGTISLDDLKGTYLYIDVWATWCSPCKAEIPHLKKIEKAYHGRNIKFLSISLDEAKNHEAWRTMIKDKEMGGIQLIAEKEFKSQFAQDFRINSIPRFILIDPNGIIVDGNAPRPSNPKLIALFKKLKI